MDPPCLRYSFWLCETNVYKTYFIYEVDFFEKIMMLSYKLEALEQWFSSVKLSPALRFVPSGLSSEPVFFKAICWLKIMVFKLFRAKREKKTYF